MARHRLLDVKRNRKAHKRVGPTGVLYSVIYMNIWLTPGDRIVNLPLMLPPVPFDYTPEPKGGPHRCLKCRRPTDSGGSLCGICKHEPTAL